MTDDPPASRAVVTRPAATLHGQPDARAECVSECLFGERVTVLERRDGWARVENVRDRYTGWLVADALGAPASREPPRHLVGARATLLFAAPDLKSAVLARVPFGAELALDAAEDGAPFARVPGAARLLGASTTGDRARSPGAPDAAANAGAVPVRPDGGGGLASGGATDGEDEPPAKRAVGVENGGAFASDDGSAPEPGRTPGGGHDAWVWRAHCLGPGGRLAGTPIDVARRLFDGAPYRWGGRTPDGADCSGLVQGTALALGLPLPRDSADQERAVAEVVEPERRTASDLVFWTGHVALLIDPDTLFHATAHTLATAVEPLADVVARAGEPTSYRRLPLGREPP